MHFFARDTGVISLLAKGAKRPKSKTGGAIDLMSEGDLVFIPSNKGTLGTLIEFTETLSRLTLRKDASRLNSAMYIIEIVSEMLAENDPHPELFDLLHNALVRLAQDGAPLLAVLAYFQWRALRHVGLLGDLGICVSCQTLLERPDDAKAFSSRQGGVLCGACARSAGEKYALNSNAISGMSALAAAEAGRKVPLNPMQASAAGKVLAYHISQQIGKPLRMEKYLPKPAPARQDVTSDQASRTASDAAVITTSTAK